MPSVKKGIDIRFSCLHIDKLLTKDFIVLLNENQTAVVISVETSTTKSQQKKNKLLPNQTHPTKHLQSYTLHSEMSISDYSQNLRPKQWKISCFWLEKDIMTESFFIDVSRDL